MLTPLSQLSPAARWAYAAVLRHFCPWDPHKPICGRTVSRRVPSLGRAKTEAALAELADEMWLLRYHFGPGMEGQGYDAELQYRLR
jgi:hypothetical protein